MGTACFSLSEVSHLYIVASSKLSHRTFAVTVATLSRAHMIFSTRLSWESNPYHPCMVYLPSFTIENN